MDINNAKGIMVFCEINGDKIIENSLELLGEATVIKSKLSHHPEVSAVILGQGTERFVDIVTKHGADKVILVEGLKYVDYRPDYFAEGLGEVAKKYRPEILLIGASVKGEEIGPTVAMILNTGMAAHCVEFKVDEKDKFIQVVPAFGGKVLGDILCPNNRPQMASMKAGLANKIIFKDKKSEVETFSPNVVGFGEKIEIEEIIKNKNERISLNKAEIIVTGGFGIGNQDGWNKIEKLAGLLNGVTACTRASLDEGWTKQEETMIGTSGVAVKPKVYLGFAVSGAAHHTCGIKGADTIITVNRDANAAIFDVSDFKIVSDWEKIVDALILQLESK